MQCASMKLLKSACIRLSRRLKNALKISGTADERRTRREMRKKEKDMILDSPQMLFAFLGG